VETSEPQQELVGSGWSVADPLVTPVLEASFPEWSPLLHSALIIFERVTQEGRAATLSRIAYQETWPQDPEREREYWLHLRGIVVDAVGEHWTMFARSQAPSISGGYVRFRNLTQNPPARVEGPQGRTIGTYKTVHVELNGRPADPYSGTVAVWNMENLFGSSGDEWHCIIDDHYSAVMTKVVSGLDPAELMPDDARDLASALLELADRLDAGPPGGYGSA
jgi:hypothetical protein